MKTVTNMIYLAETGINGCTEIGIYTTVIVTQNTMLSDKCGIINRAVKCYSRIGSFEFSR